MDHTVKTSRKTVFSDDSFSLMSKDLLFSRHIFTFGVKVFKYIFCSYSSLVVFHQDPDFPSSFSVGTKRSSLLSFVGFVTSGFDRDFDDYTVPSQVFFVLED